MQRRELLALLGAAATSSLLAPLSASERLDVSLGVHTALRAGARGKVLTADELRLVGVIGDTILPRTETPGATDVGVPDFIDLMMTEWYPAAAVTSFHHGLRAIDRSAWRHLSWSFVGLSESTRLTLLKKWDAGNAADTATGGFKTLKLLTIYGYFTSEKVMKDVMKRPIIPGRYDPCISLPA